MKRKKSLSDRVPKPNPARSNLRLDPRFQQVEAIINEAIFWNDLDIGLREMLIEQVVGAVLVEWPNLKDLSPGDFEQQVRRIAWRIEQCHKVPGTHTWRIQQSVELGDDDGVGDGDDNPSYSPLDLAASDAGGHEIPWCKHYNHHRNEVEDRMIDRIDRHDQLRRVISCLTSEEVRFLVKYFSHKRQSGSRALTV